MYNKPFVIAEVGCNHMGQMDIAKDFIEIAAHFCFNNHISDSGFIP